MAFVYILYSKSLDSFYIGSTTLAVEVRLDNHNTLYYENKFTSKGVPWELFYYLETESREVAEEIERHIKRMKSRKYIMNLKTYPEMGQKLKSKYS